jgi:acetyl/propionyl-CoA carboxylase alpha subunit
MSEADAVGYPLLVKAVMGGGGKGMKLALDRSQVKVLAVTETA